jgi:hypothetical protein
MAQLMTSDDRTGENVVLGVEWSGAGGGAFLVYIDHIRGTVVSDAFPTPAPIDDVMRQLETANREQGRPAELIDFEQLDLALARSVVEEALDNADETSADPDSETWPAGRPILAWLLSTMPERGGGWAELDDQLGDPLGDLGDFDRPDDSPFDVIVDALVGRRSELVERFSASTAATAIDLDTTNRDTDRAALAVVVGGVEPMRDEEFLRWTPDRVQNLLFGVALRTILVDDSIARRIPSVLKAFALWCLEEAGVPKGELTAVRDAVDRSTPDFVELATSLEATRLRDAVKEYAMLLGDPVGIVPVLESNAMFDWTEFLLDHAASEVGGREALMDLRTDALPNEDFDWSLVPTDAHGVVAEVLRLLDALADEHFDVEFRTACRRFLAAMVSGDPDVLRRGSTSSAAAVVAWLVGRSNGVVARGGDGMPAGQLWAHFGVKSGASARAQTFRRAAGLAPYSTADALGRPEWLTSEVRQDLIRQRDKALAGKEAEGPVR